MAVVALVCLGAARATDTERLSGAAPAAQGGVHGVVYAQVQDAVQTAVIRDPGMDMDAYTVTYPARWHFQGALVPGTPCMRSADLVFRVFSPDGLAEIEKMLTLTWRWADSGHTFAAPEGCAPLKTAMSAADYLKYISSILGVEYVGEQPVAPAMAAGNARHVDEVNAMWAKTALSSKQKPSTMTRDVASATVRYRNNTFSMAGRLDGKVECVSTPQPFAAQHPWSTHFCSASAYYVHAPDARFNAVIAQTDTVIRVTAVTAWLQATDERRLRQAYPPIGDYRYYGEQHFYALPARQGKDLMRAMQLGTDSATRRAARIANTAHAIALDWTDIVLDPHTNRWPDSAQTMRAATRYTWLDTSAKAGFQTDDPDADPNGVLPGTWSRQQPVPGDSAK
jgi:hypothetical protein